MRPSLLPRLARTIAAAAALIVLFLALSSPAASQSGTHSAYLPLVVGPAASPPPPQSPAEGGAFVERTLETQSPEAAVDARGGLHFAYASLVPLEQNPQAFYSYCPAQPLAACANPASWRTVRLGRNVEEVQLRLTRAGRPRLMLRESSADSFTKVYRYASCDTACQSAAGWQLASVGTVGSPDAGAYDQPARSFALDAQDRPRLVYYGGQDGSASTFGAFYTWCDTGCAQAASWRRTRIVEPGGVLDYPVLALTADGRPRVLGVTFSGDGELRYFACDSACGSAASWSSAALMERGAGLRPYWDLALDGAGQPRIAFLQGEVDGSPEQLLYAWCAGDCLERSSWDALSFGLGSDGRDKGFDPDLELDAQGRPRIAFHATTDGGGLGYIWCNANCTRPDGDWHDRVIELNDDLSASFPPVTPLNCAPKYWFAGQQPDLQLDASGAARVAYSAEWTFECTRQPDPQKPPQSYIASYQYTRFAFFPQPH